MGQRVPYAYAGVTTRRFIEAVTRANISKSAERVAFGLIAMLSTYSKVDDTMTISQIAEFAYPEILEGLDPQDLAAFKNATRQTSRGLSNLYKNQLIDYRHATGTSPIAWVSIERHAPPDSDPTPRYAASGDKPGPLGRPTGIASGDTQRHPSEKTMKSPRTHLNPIVETEPSTSEPADMDRNVAEVRKIRDASQNLQRSGVHTKHETPEQLDR
jgi:hypothetical protein